MPKNYWMFVQTPEEFETSKGLEFTLHGLKSRHRRRAQRMEPDDRVLFYVNGIRKWAVSGSVASRYFEDRTPIWNSNGSREEFPYRVKLSPSIILEEKDYIDARELGPRLDYVKRWVPERWPLAFIDTLHLLPQRDFRLIEGEMKRIVRKGRKRRRNRRPDRDVSQRVDGAVEASGAETSVVQTEAAAPSDDVAVGAVGEETSVAQTDASAPPDDAAGEAVSGETSAAQADAPAPLDDAVEDTGPEAAESDVQPARQDHERPESGPEGDGTTRRRRARRPAPDRSRCRTPRGRGPGALPGYPPSPAWL